MTPPKQKPDGRRRPERIRRWLALRKAAKFIAHWEGGRDADGKFYPYWDALGRVWTQGIGHIAGVDGNDKPWSLRKALRVCRKDARSVLDALMAIVPRGLNLKVNEIAALVSAGFNLGAGIFDRGRSLGDAIRAGDRKAIADALLLYDHAGGQQVLGLTRRREAERRLFLKRRKKR